MLKLASMLVCVCVKLKLFFNWPSCQERGVEVLVRPKHLITKLHSRSQPDLVGSISPPGSCPVSNFTSSMALCFKEPFINRSVLQCSNFCFPSPVPLCGIWNNPLKHCVCLCFSSWLLSYLSLNRLWCQHVAACLRPLNLVNVWGYMLQWQVARVIYNLTTWWYNYIRGVLSPVLQGRRDDGGPTWWLNRQSHLSHWPHQMFLCACVFVKWSIFVKLLSMVNGLFSLFTQFLVKLFLWSSVKTFCVSCKRCH